LAIVYSFTVFSGGFGGLTSIDAIKIKIPRTIKPAAMEKRKTPADIVRAPAAKT